MFRAARNTLWELCALGKARTPFKSIGTCCRTVRPAVASGWPRGCRGRLGGYRGCPVSWRCQWVSSQAGGSTQGPGHGGAAWGQLRMWGWKVWGQGSKVFSGQRALVCMVMHVHPCSRVFRRAWHCPFLGVCFGVGRTWAAGSGPCPWLVSGSVQASGARARGQTGLHCPQIPLTPPAPATGTALGCATKLCPLPAPIPLGGQWPLHSHLLSLPTQCFELYILQKQPRPIVCTGEGLGALSWGTDFPGSSAEDSRCPWKKKKESSPFYFKTADSNTMQYMLVFVSGRCV